MKTISVRAPMRADLAGGTLDLWPLYLFHPGSRTVNVAISCFAECQVSRSSSGAIEVHLADQSYEGRYESAAQVIGDANAALVGHAVDYFNLSGIRVETRSEAPRGSGLGGSSAVAVALVRALSEYAERPVEGDDLVALVRDLETRLLGIPAGIQDYYPAVYGGLGSIHLEPGSPARHPIQFPLSDLAEHLVIHYSDVSHFSGTNNWEIYRRHIEGDHKIRKGLSEIAAAAREMETALETGDLARAGGALRAEWKLRKRLVKGISTPEIDAAIIAAANAGAWGGKVCGAGGGGCIVFLAPRERRSAVVDALGSVAGRTLPFVPIAGGLEIESRGDKQTPAIVASERRAREVSDAVEQVFMTGGDAAAYQPWALAEANVVYDAQRAGIRWTESRCLIAPIDWIEGKVDWNASIVADPNRFRLSSVPDPDRQRVTDDSQVVEWARYAEESLRQYLAERERLVLLYNPAFQLYSQPGETRESFRKRCQEAVKDALEIETKRLESVFRRRVDQLKEKADKEERDKPQDIDATFEGPPDEVNIAWGQMLYNITSGKPAPVFAPQSLREIDYVEQIMALQRQWDRERENLIEQLNDQARSIEELIVEPDERNVELQRFRVVWASRGEMLRRLRGE